MVGMILLSIITMSCAGKEIMPGKAQGMAWVEISSTTAKRIAAAAKKVFIEDGYEVVNEENNMLVFEKPGSRIKDFTYGGLANQEGVWVKVVLTIKDKSNGTYWVAGDAYMVKNRDDDFFREETKVLKLFGQEYQRLLNRVKQEAAP
jgi:hypothetical protein